MKDRWLCGEVCCTSVYTAKLLCECVTGQMWCHVQPVYLELFMQYSGPCLPGLVNCIRSSDIQLCMMENVLDVPVLSRRDAWLQLRHFGMSRTYCMIHGSSTIEIVWMCLRCRGGTPEQSESTPPVSGLCHQSETLLNNCNNRGEI